MWNVTILKERYFVVEKVKRNSWKFQFGSVPYLLQHLSCWSHTSLPPIVRAAQVYLS